MLYNFLPSVTSTWPLCEHLSWKQHYCHLNKRPEILKGTGFFKIYSLGNIVEFKNTIDEGITACAEFPVYRGVANF